VKAEKAGVGHEADHAGGDDHLPEPVPRDPDLPTVSNTSIALVAAGALIAVFVALFVLFG
jgi:hypothetical protein